MKLISYTLVRGVNTVGVYNIEVLMKLRTIGSLSIALSPRQRQVNSVGPDKTKIAHNIALFSRVMHDVGISEQIRYYCTGILDTVRQQRCFKLILL